jgi:branched-chain amino acid transport system substrate-binding protein
MVRKRFIPIFVMFVVLGTIQVFSSSPAFPAEEVKLGFAYPISGPAAQTGEEGMRGGQMAVKEINDAGGITVGGKKYLIKLIVEDSEYSTAKAVSAVNKLIFQDGVKWVGIQGTPAFLASRGVTEPAKVILTGLASIRDVLSPKTPYTFRTSVGAEARTPIQQVWLSENRPTVKRIGLIFADTQIAKEMVETLSRTCPKVGQEFVATELHDPATQDFSAILTRTMPKKPDGIVINLATKGIGPMIKQSREMGFKGIFIGAGVMPGELPDLAGKQNMEGTLLLTPDVKSSVTPKGVRDFYDRFRSKYSVEPGESGLTGYLDVQIFAQTLEKSGKVDDTDAWKSTLETQKFNTIWGEVYFGMKDFYGIGHQIMIPLLITEYKDGGLRGIGIVKPDKISEIMARIWGK